MRISRISAVVAVTAAGFVLAAPANADGGLGIGPQVSELATQGIYGPQLAQQVRLLQLQNGIGPFNPNRFQPFNNGLQPFDNRWQQPFNQPPQTFGQQLQNRLNNAFGNDQLPGRRVGQRRRLFQRGNGFGRGRGRAFGRGRSFGRGRGRR